MGRFTERDFVEMVRDGFGVRITQKTIGQAFGKEETHISKVFKGKRKLSPDNGWKGCVFLAKELMGKENSAEELITSVKVYLKANGFISLAEKCSDSNSKEDFEHLLYSLLTEAMKEDGKEEPKAEEKMVLQEKRDPILENILPAKYSNILGREVEISKINEIFADDNIVILCGMGGIGKSCLAFEYADRNYMSTYSCIQRVVFESDMETTIGQLKFEGIIDDQKEKDPKALYEEKLRYLKRLDRKSLIIIDNMDIAPKDAPELEQMFESGCNILITTRNESYKHVREQSFIKVNELSEEDQFKVFKRNYTGMQKEEEEECREILQLVKGHTLVIELVAKTMEDGDINAGEMLQILQAGFDIDIDIQIKYKEKSYHEKMIWYLNSLFKMDYLSDEEKTLLMLLAWCPISGISRKEFAETFYADHFAAKNKINNLVSSGWIIKDISGNKLIWLHPVISEVINANMKAKYSEYKNFFDILYKKLKKEKLYETLKLYSNIACNAVERTDFCGLEQARYLFELGDCIQEHAFHAIALEILQKGVSILNEESNLPEEKELIVKYHNKIALVYQKKTEYKQAILHNNKAVILCKGFKGADIIKMNLFTDLGCVHRKNSDYDQAIAYYEDALAICGRMHRENTLQCAEIHNGLGLVYLNNGETEKALKQYEIALKIREIYAQNYPGEDVRKEIAYSYHNIGSAYNKLEKYQEALEYHRKAYESRKEFLTAPSVPLAESINYIGVDYVELKKYDKAITFFDKALSMREELYGEKHSQIGWSYYSFGNVYFEKGEYFKAEEYLLKTLDVWKEVLGENHLYMGKGLYLLSKVKYKTGCYEEAINYANKALGIQEEKNHPEAEATKELIARITAARAD